jgi:outer membrane protein assembly factor BamB
LFAAGCPIKESVVPDLSLETFLASVDRLVSPAASACVSRTDKEYEMNRCFAAFFALACVSVLSAADPDPAMIQNWHQWRGPLANGTAPKADPPLKWGEKTNIRWKAALPGRGSSTPVVWGDRVFVLAAEKSDRQPKPNELPVPDPKFKTRTTPPGNFYRFLVFCFDRNSGKKLWERVAAERVPHEGHHPTHSYAAGSPTTDGKFLYASFGSFGNYCYDLDGKLVWSRDLGRINTRLGWGESVTPVVHGSSLLLNYDQEADSKLYCLDTATGKTKWAVDREEHSTWSTPLVTGFEGKTQVIANGTTQIRSYDLETGKLIWSCGGMSVNAIPSPVRVGDSVVCMSGYQKSAAVSIPLSAKGDLGTGLKGVNWRISSGTPYVPSPAVVGDRLYFTQKNDNILTVLDAKTGKVVINRVRLPQTRSFYSSPVVAAGRVYLVDRSGTTLVLKAGDKVEELAVNRLDDAIDASPVAVGKQLFLRGEKYLYCIEEK